MPPASRNSAPRAPTGDIPVPADGETWAIGAVILNQDVRAFAQKRSAHRRLFPDCWERLEYLRITRRTVVALVGEPNAAQTRGSSSVPELSEHRACQQRS